MAKPYRTCGPPRAGATMHAGPSHRQAHQPVHLTRGHREERLLERCESALRVVGVALRSTSSTATWPRTWTWTSRRSARRPRPTRPHSSRRAGPGAIRKFWSFWPVCSGVDCRTPAANPNIMPSPRPTKVLVSAAWRPHFGLRHAPDSIAMGPPPGVAHIRRPRSVSSGASVGHLAMSVASSSHSEA